MACRHSISGLILISLLVNRTGFPETVWLVFKLAWKPSIKSREGCSIPRSVKSPRRLFLGLLTRSSYLRSAYCLLAYLSFSAKVWREFQRMALVIIFL